MTCYYLNLPYLRSANKEWLPCVAAVICFLKDGEGMTIKNRCVSVGIKSYRGNADYKKTRYIPVPSFDLDHITAAQLLGSNSGFISTVAHQPV